MPDTKWRSLNVSMIPRSPPPPPIPTHPSYVYGTEIPTVPSSFHTPPTEKTIHCPVELGTRYNISFCSTCVCLQVKGFVATCTSSPASSCASIPLSWYWSCTETKHSKPTFHYCLFILLVFVHIYTSECSKGEDGGKNERENLLHFYPL